VWCKYLPVKTWILTRISSSINAVLDEVSPIQDFNMACSQNRNVVKTLPSSQREVRASVTERPLAIPNRLESEVASGARFDSQEARARLETTPVSERAIREPGDGA
jgi:hypothetical protein